MEAKILLAEFPGWRIQCSVAPLLFVSRNLFRKYVIAMHIRFSRELV